MDVHEIVLSRFVVEPFLISGTKIIKRLFQKSPLKVEILKRKKYDATDVDQKEQIAALSFFVFWFLGILIFLVGFVLIITLSLINFIVYPSFQIPFFLMMSFFIMGGISRLKNDYIGKKKKSHDLTRSTFLTTVCDLDFLIALIIGYLITR